MPAHSDSARAAGLNPAALLKACPRLTEARRLVVGFSGGLDSTVLLHLISELHKQKHLPAPVTVVHVNHGLQRAATEWQDYCAEVCAQLDLPILIRNVTVDLSNNASPEEAARSARYAAFENILEDGDQLLLAHHQDDQLETVLFRLIRGSGAKGLAGIPVTRPCGHGVILRPLLGFRRSQLRHYALQNQLAWINDGSNLDERYDRNFLRSAVIPQLVERFPGITNNVMKSALLCQESDELANELAALDLATCVGTFRNRLHIPSLQQMSEPRQRNLLRHWIAGLQAEMECAAPGHMELHRIVNEVLPAAPDGEPSVFWGRDEQRIGIRRHRDQLYLLKPMPAVPEEFVWNTAAPLELPFPLGTLQLILKNDLTATPDALRTLRVCFRKGGEQVRQENRPTRSLKKILQESAIPSWLRESVPLLYTGDELLAVADLIICRTSSSSPNITEINFQIDWVRPELHCGY